jgi:hypothetical protein
MDEPRICEVETEEPVMETPDEVIADMRSSLEGLLRREALEMLRHTQEVQALVHRGALVAWEAWRATGSAGDRDALRAAAIEMHRIAARLSEMALATCMGPWPADD